ncbi:MAG: hypothetical protein Tsb0020_32180 [Haliangiales bacterium]
MGWGVAVALLLATVSAAGCGGASQGPEDALSRYREALARKDYSDAYTMMGSEFRERYSRDEYVRMMEESGADVVTDPDALIGGRGDVEVSAAIDDGEGAPMRLVLEGGVWKIATNPIEFYSQSTAREALLSFLRAYRLQRWNIMLRFVPDQYRERMSASDLQRQFEGERRDEMRELMLTLQINQHARITVKGAEARMRYGDGREVIFVEEYGSWKIADLD